MVYEVPCRDCNSVYVGETGRSLEMRLREHKYAVKTGDTKNGIAVHAWTKEHQVNWDAAKVRVREQQLTRRKAMESLLIRQHANSSNLDKGMNLSQIWKPLLT